MGRTSNLAAVLGACFAGVTLIGSLVIMGFSAVIALGVDATSRPDYLAGQAQFLGKSTQEYGVNNALSEHPYYGIFFFDILTM